MLEHSAFEDDQTFEVSETSKVLRDPEASDAARSAFDYALVRVVPHVIREEFVNAGVIVFSRARRFLGARIALDEARVLALAPAADLAAIRAQLDLIPRICSGDPGAGLFAELDPAERFHWLVSPRSTVVQVSPVHCGLSDDPQAALDELFARLVL